jgi:hypothetical protein
MKSGIEYMVFLSDWYPKIVQTVLVFSNRWRNSRRFPICVVPMLYQDMEMHDVPFGVISVKFQIQPVTVPILEQYQMKKTWGKFKKHQNLLLNLMLHCSAFDFRLFIRSIEYFMKRVIVDYAKLTNAILNLWLTNFQMVMMIQILLVLEMLK